MSPGERKKRQLQKERRRRARERRQGEKREWNQFHSKLEKAQPKKKYVKMSDRTIKVDNDESKLAHQEARSKSTIHSSARASVSVAPRFLARERYGAPQQSIDLPGSVILQLPSIEEGTSTLSARRRALETIKREVENRVNSPGPTSAPQLAGSFHPTAPSPSANV